MLEKDVLTFDRWLRRRRKAFDLTQEQIARQIGCSVETIRKIEAGERRPSRQIAELLAQTLQLIGAERDLFVRIARMEPGLQQDAQAQALPPFPPLSPPPTPPAVAPTPSSDITSTGHQLPQPPALIGREHEIAQLCAYLQRADVRLLNLIGPGGIGKTSLALHVATDLTASFSGGVVFVPLAALSDAALVIPTIAHALGVQHRDQEELTVQIAAVLYGAEVLLVLDNFEHLLDSAPAIDALLAGTQRLKILITSRTRLQLYHEHSFPIHPLSLTEHSRAPITVEQALHSNAVKLFVRRAQMVQPDFTLDPDNAAVVAEICERLDGMPLAIELAAARTRLLPPAALLRRLHDRFALLTTTIANLPERQQTLRATLDWSYNLLTPAEQNVFMRLAVFPSGCTLDAIEQVVATPEAAPILEIVESLLHKSLLNQVSRNGEPWLSMLETVCAYAMERLTESGQAARLWDLCARYYVTQIEAIEDELSGPQQEHYLADLAREHDNLRAILTWLLERSAQRPSDFEAALRLCGVLWRFWWVRGYLYEGRRWLERALAVSAMVQPDIRAKALRGAGVLARAQGDLASAELYLTESLTLWRELQSTSGIALALNSLGVLLFNQRAYDRAEPFFEESRLLHQSLGDQPRVAIALNNLGNIAFKQGDLEQAAERYTASLQLLHGDHANHQTVALIQTNLAEIARLREDYVGATSILYESATIYRELNEVEGLLFCLNNLAEIALDRQHGELAARLLGVTDALYEQIGAVRAPDLAIDYERQINAARSLIPDQVFEEHQRHGRSTTIDRILADTIAIITA